MKRKRWTAEEKFQIVLEGLQGKGEIADLCTRYEIHQSHYYQWRTQFLKTGAKVFSAGKEGKREEQLHRRMAKMQQLIGELTLELKKND